MRRREVEHWYEVAAQGHSAVADGVVVVGAGAGVEQSRNRLASEERFACLEWFEGEGRGVADTAAVEMVMRVRRMVVDLGPARPSCWKSQIRK